MDTSQPSRDPSLRLLLASLAAATVVACGGGGGADGGGSTPPPGGGTPPPVVPPEDKPLELSSGNVEKAGIAGIGGAEGLLQLLQVAADTLDRIYRQPQTHSQEECRIDPFASPSGTIDYDFSDADQNGRPSNGDTISASFRSCYRQVLHDTLDGVIRIELREPPQGPRPVEQAYAATLLFDRLSVGRSTTADVTVAGSARIAVQLSRELLAVSMTMADPGLTISASGTAGTLVERYRSGSIGRDIDYAAATMTVDVQQLDVHSQFAGGQFTCTTTTPFTNVLNMPPTRGTLACQGEPSALFYFDALDETTRNVGERFGGATKPRPWEDFIALYLFWDPRFGAKPSGDLYPVGAGTAGQRFDVLFSDPAPNSSAALAVNPAFTFYYSRPVDPASTAAVNFKRERNFFQDPGIPATIAITGAKVVVTPASQLLHGTAYRPELAGELRTAGLDRGFSPPPVPSFRTGNSLVAEGRASPGAALPAASVLLIGDRSAATAGSIASHRWTQLSGTPVTLLDSDRANASFTVPPGAADGEAFEFDLTVRNDRGEEDTDRVIAYAHLPVAGEAMVYLRNGESDSEGETPSVSRLYSSARQAIAFEHAERRIVRIEAKDATAGNSLARLEMWTAFGNQLQLGDYGITRSSGFFLDGVAPLSSSAYCEGITGRFDVREIELEDPNTIRKLAIDFSYRCPGSAEPAMAGSVRIDSTVPLP
ncbi:MAG: hypothetical protein AB7P31_14545 [Steroidobacteraceae bacterium]